MKTIILARASTEERINERRKIMRNFLLFFISLSILTAPVAKADPANNESFQFAQAMITSLSWVKEARDVSLARPEDADLFTLMKSMRETQQKIESAKLELKPFIASKNELISAAAASFCVYYDYVVLLENKGIDQLERLGNMSPEELSKNQGTIAKESSALGADIDEAWKQLVNHTAASTGAFVTFDEKRIATNRLNLTQKEIDTLSAELLRIFGNEIKEGIKTGQHPITAAPAGLWQFLNLQGLKASDAA